MSHVINNKELALLRVAVPVPYFDDIDGFDSCKTILPMGIGVSISVDVGEFLLLL